MHWDSYIRLSALMGLEYAIWGAWLPVLAVRLLGPLKMTGKQTGWIYATLPLACIFAPLDSGYLADKWFNAEWILLASHAAGAVLLVAAARQTKFWGMFSVMFLYAVCYAATLPLVNKMVLEQITDPITRGWVFFWGCVAWALTCYFLTGLRQLRKSSGDGPDSLYLAATLSGLMAAVCFLQSPSVPASQGNPIGQAIGMLANFHYSLFILIQLAVAATVQFYFVGTGRFLQDKGISGRNISAAMGVAQAAQAAATVLLLGWFIKSLGFHWIFVIGGLCWALLYFTYLASRWAWPLVIVQAFHGLAYMFFLVGGQIFVSDVAPKEISGSAQSLIFVATTGIGFFLGAQFAGRVMEWNSTDGKFRWPRIWIVPLAITLAGAIVFAGVFRTPKAEDFQSRGVKSSVPAVGTALGHSPRYTF
jgi:MFS family permease